MGRWAIKSSQQWVLDVTFDEDAYRTRALNAARHLALLRRLAANLLKVEESKLSIRAKRLPCASSRIFLCNSLNAFKLHAKSLPLAQPPPWAARKKAKHAD